MKITGIIPARFASRRFPGKPLASIAGKPMIQWVFERASLCGDLTDLYVATDDERILKAVEGFGGKCIMTSPQHPTGTDRCSEVAAALADTEAVINIQGDEPLIHPGQISEVAALLKAGADIATLARHSTSEEDYFNPNIVKVLFDDQGWALQFTRGEVKTFSPQSYWKHIGIYGFRRNTLLKITELPPGRLEMMERLEQLRWMENGYQIKVGTTNFHSISIDTPEDLKKLDGCIG